MRRKILMGCVVALALGTGVRAEEGDVYLKKQLLNHHQRHVPTVVIKGNEVKLIYNQGEQWRHGDPAFDEVARMDALDCLKADYAQLKKNPKHKLHEYFHVTSYSTSSHE